MASRRSLILDAIYNAVNGGGKPAGVAVHRSKTAPYAKSDLPAMVVYRVGEETVTGDGPRPYKVKRAITVRIECRVSAATDGEVIEDAQDPLTSWAVQAVMADVTQGGLAHNTTELRTLWLVEDADAVYGAAAIDFQVTYITAAGNPDAA